MSEPSAEIDQSIDNRSEERVQNMKHFALKAHDAILKETGGSPGVRDMGALESATAAPFQTFFGEELHETPIDKAAALWRSLTQNHPFVDGNKRVGFLLTAVHLLEYGHGFKDPVSDDAIVDECIAIAKGEQDVDQIADWLKENTDGASARNFSNVMQQLSANDSSL